MRLRTIRRGDGLGQGLAVIAMLCQVLSVLLPMESEAAGRAFSGTAALICHAGGDTPAHDRTSFHHWAGCTLCPLCMASALLPLASDGAALPLPPSRQLARAVPAIRGRWSALSPCRPAQGTARSVVIQPRSKRGAQPDPRLTERI